MTYRESTLTTPIDPDEAAIRRRVAAAVPGAAGIAASFVLPMMAESGRLESPLTFGSHDPRGLAIVWPLLLAAAVLAASTITLLASRRRPGRRVRGAVAAALAVTGLSQVAAVGAWTVSGGIPLAPVGAATLLWVGFEAHWWIRGVRSQGWSALRYLANAYTLMAVGSAQTLAIGMLVMLSGDSHGHEVLGCGAAVYGVSLGLLLLAHLVPTTRSKHAIA